METFFTFKNPGGWFRHFYSLNCFMSICIHKLFFFFLLTFYTQILKEQQMLLGRAVHHISILIFKKITD